MALCSTNLTLRNEATGHGGRGRIYERTLIYREKRPRGLRGLSG
jgi:hypothetical protein